MADPALAGHHQDNRSETTGAAGISDRHGVPLSTGDQYVVALSDPQLSWWLSRWVWHHLGF